MEKLDKLRFIIQRIDHYYNGVNLKGTFFLGVNTFILGGCLAAYQSDLNIEKGGMMAVNFTLIALFSLTSIAFVLWSILPYLNHGESYDYESNIFFGSIAKKDFKEFNEAISQVEDKGLQDDMIRQIHILSKGLNRKYIRIRNAGILLFLTILATITFFYQIILTP